MDNRWKYVRFTNLIYQSIFKENAVEYRKVLKLATKDNIRETLYSEVLDLIASYESGIPHELEKASTQLGRKLSMQEAEALFAKFESHPLFKPLVMNARTKMASRDLGSVRHIGHQAITVRGIHVPGMLWDGDQEPGFVGVQASFDEVGGVAADPELFEGLAGVFGTQMQLLAVPDVSNSQNHQGPDADPNPCLALGWGSTVWLEQHLGVGAEVGFSDLREVNQDRGVFASGVPVWVGNLAKPVHSPVGIVIRKCRDVEGLLRSSRRSGCSTAGRRFNQNYPDKY